MRTLDSEKSHCPLKSHNPNNLWLCPPPAEIVLSEIFIHQEQAHLALELWQFHVCILHGVHKGEVLTFLKDPADRLRVHLLEGV